MKRLVIIDGKSVFYRGYYAMGALALADGTPTGGVYGFAAMAMEIVRRLEPTKVVVAWDAKDSAAARRRIYPEYKAGRVKPDEDFYTQIPLLESLVQALGWSFVEASEYEADDIIGALSLQADEELDQSGKCSWETYIISSDLDMLQIVDENTRMWRIVSGFSKIEEFDVAEIENKYGIKKEQFLDMKALKGDASDNIPGVPGIGEKTAVKLLQDYQSLTGVYEHLAEITSSVRKKLDAGKELAFMSLQLARIMTEAPVELAKLPDFVWDKERVRVELERLEFYSLIKKFALERQTDDEIEKAEKASAELPKEVLVDWDIKALMHQDKEVAEEILVGRQFWDLSQGKFLLNPLARTTERTSLSAAEKAAEYARQRDELKHLPDLYKIFQEYDLALIPVLYGMEKRGMLINKAYFADLKKEFEQRAVKFEQKIWKQAGREFNVNSPVQLSELLFDVLKLPTKGIKKTTRGYSTGSGELEKLKEAHPIIATIREYREVAKLLSTYVLPLPELADKAGRIHTTFTQNVTATGRLSSLNPNLQNIPVRTEEGRRIRAGFVAAPGKVLVSADYSQFELRLAAVLAGDENLIEDFNAGVDIHTKTAAEVFGVAMDKVSEKQRRAAKVINFGVLYGMSVKGLATTAQMDMAEAKQFIDSYFELRRPIRDFLDAVLKKARERGYVQTFYGRRRPTPDVKSTNFLVRTAAERAAQNMPIQGTEADLMKRAMIRVYAKLPAGADLVMQVHDSLIVECDKAVLEQVREVLVQEMTMVAPELKVKLAVDVTVGDNWGQL